MNLKKIKKINELFTALNQSSPGEVFSFEGNWGSFGRLLVSQLYEKIDRPVLYICPHIDDADNACDDLRSFGLGYAEVFSSWEGEEDIFADATDEIASERLRVALDLFHSEGKPVVTSSVQAICQMIPDLRHVEENKLSFQLDREVSPDHAAQWLVDSGYERVDKIDLPGQFAMRGGIIDVFAPLVSDIEMLENKPRPCVPEGLALRIEFFGDTVESIRQINLDTQRSTDQLKRIDIVASIAGLRSAGKENLLNVLKDNTLIIMEESGDIEDVADVFYQRAERQDRLFSWQNIYEKLNNFPQLRISRFGTGTEKNSYRLGVKSIQKYQQTSGSVWSSHKEALEELVELAVKGKEVNFYCESSAEIARVTEIIEQSRKVPRNFRMVLGFITQGFEVEKLKTIVISHHELFGQYTLRRKQRAFRSSAPVDTLSDLTVGDYVVHVNYGIGKFLGTKFIERDGVKSEYLTIGYADGVKIQVSVNNINLVQKFIGTSPKRPKLSKIGTKKWEKQKKQVAESVEDLAAELLEVQAKRQAMGGIKYGPDSEWQVEFEESFPYQETADQLTAIEEIKSDMKQPIAMDRLLCGDVGFGKTEVAMRAAFKAVENGKQVAMLVPTTVLSVQHGRTFSERFADFPVSIEVLNRFRTTKEAKDIIERAKKKRVDIVIGTHRLLSKDVGFADLGLLIIDEEQRFGVRHKEKLKKLRFDVDVLTMTATPIPRTLHFSLLGLRDISSLGTPPLDRRSVVTKVTRHSRELLRRGIIREKNRQGQVFFLHNRVKTIEKKAAEIRKTIEDIDVNIDIAHGQMNKRELENAMINFVTGSTDVLVCTTIIESGLDIPNANTIFIDNADRFGLAELHQLRGRVGRYKHRAYAYMLLPRSRPVTPVGGRRLKAIEEYSHLGAGFRIALRDLEIRGAGNILGPEQSGHIQVVGYQMYCDMLASAVRRLKNEPAEEEPRAVIDLGFSAYIPKNYIATDNDRLEAYRKIMAAKNMAEIEEVAGELDDVYGTKPEQVDTLFDIAELRISADRWDIKSVITDGDKLLFNFNGYPGKDIDVLFADVKGQVNIVNKRQVCVKPGKNYFEPGTLLSFLRKIFKKERVTDKMA